MAEGTRLPWRRGPALTPPASSAQWVSWIGPIGDTAVLNEQGADAARAGSETASPEASLDMSLAHEPAMRVAQDCLYRTVMAASNGLCGAELELVAAAVSRANGRSVRSPRADWLSSGKESLQSSVRVLMGGGHGDGGKEGNGGDGGDGGQRDPGPRWRALVDYAVAMSDTPPAAGASELAGLRLMGFSDLEILDATHAIAVIAWVDRLRLTLGQSVGN